MGNVTNPIERRLSVGLLVDSVKDLPKAGAYLKRFLDEVDIAHGPFSVNVVISAGGAEVPQPTVEIIYTTDDEDRSADYERERD